MHLFLKAEPQKVGKEVQGDGALADAALEVVDRGLLGFFKIGHHDVLVLLHGGLDELFAVFGERDPACSQECR